jgi:hypothetical protein
MLTSLAAFLKTSLNSAGFVDWGLPLRVIFGGVAAQSRPPNIYLKKLN